MTIKYLICVIIIVFFVLCFVYFIHPKNISLSDALTYYTLYNSDTPYAYTTQKLANGKYEVYTFDSITNTYLREESDQPYNLDGTIYENKEHGTITINNDGFNISGILQTFKCPDNFIWDKELATCITPPLCTPDDVGYYKGVTQYQFQQYSKSGIKYHDRIYIECLDGNNYNILACPSNKLYIQNDRHLISDGEPCAFYDICSESIDNTKHRQQISDYILKDNEYYICLNGESILKSCEPPLVYNISLETCTSVGPCWEKEDGYTIPIDNTTYFYCKNESERLITCPTEVYIREDGQLECEDENCSTERYTKYYSTNNFEYPIKAMICIDNKNVEDECMDSTIKYLNKPLTIQPDIYTIPKYDFYDNIIPYSSKEIQYVENSNFNKTECIELSKDNLSLYAKSNLTNASYNKILGSAAFDIFLEKFVGFNYYNYFATIYNQDGTSIAPARDYVGMLGTDKLYRYKNIDSLVLDPNHGIILNTICKIPSVLGQPRIGSFCHYSEILTIPDTMEQFYRMIIYDELNYQWKVIDVDLNIITDHNKLVRIYPNSNKIKEISDEENEEENETENETNNGVIYNPYNTTQFKSILPDIKTFEDGYIYYYVSSVTWNDRLYNLNIVIGTHFMMLFNVEDFQDPSLHFKTIYTLDDMILLDIETVLKSIPIVDEILTPIPNTLDNYFDSSFLEFSHLFTIPDLIENVEI